MDVILLENVSRLGNVGDVVNVRSGYGRNFLIPQGKAVRATKANVADFETRRASLEKLNAEKKADAEKQAKAFEGVSVKIVRQASEDGKLYGSVGVRDVAVALAEQGQEVDRRLVDLSSTIKFLGKYQATILLHADVRVAFDVEVVRSLESSLIEEDVAEDEAPEVEAAPAADADDAAPTADEEDSDAA